MKISVLIPTFNRVTSLERCFNALVGQSRQPDEVLLVARAEDEATLAFASRWSEKLPVRVALVERGGQVQALNRGLSASSGEIVAITDDDTAPRKQWLERIEAHFSADARVGAVGGRDWVHHGDLITEGEAHPVGRIQMSGRIVGNHHLGSGKARAVHFLKGANMSYRMAAVTGLRFDERLRGAGAQISNDLAFSLALGRRGWKLIYDPEVAVDHFPAPRFEGSQRGEVSLKASEDAAFNRYLALCSSAPGALRRFMACRWQVWVGTREYPGYLHLILALIRGKNVIPLWKAAVRGRRSAAQECRDRAN